MTALTIEVQDCLCIRGKCSHDGEEDGEGGCYPRQQRRRSTSPLTHSQYELRECFPCRYRPLDFFLVDRLPCVKWMKRYNLRWLLADIIAGLTVGLMVVPQALAYAVIAKLPPRYGLYSSFMGCFIYMFFGTSKDVTLGPTAILSLLTFSLTTSCSSDSEGRVPCAVALTLLSGLVQCALGILNLGFLVDFIPVPVISGFTSAAAITIAFGQVKNLFGISNVRRSPFYFTVYDTFAHLPDTNAPDILLGLGCIALVIFLKYFKAHIEHLQKRDGLHWVQKAALKFLWFLGTARNAVVVFIATLIGYSVKVQSSLNSDLTFIDYQEAQLPPICPPFDQCNDLHLGEKVDTNALDIIGELGVGIVVAPLIGFLEAIAISKAFARQGGYKVKPNQELIALGLSNVASSFVGSYPVTGSFSRTAVNAQSGVKTPAAGLITGAVVLCAIAFLSSAFDNIPIAALAAIIIAAVMPTVDVKIVRAIWKTNAVDLIPLAVSFFLTLFAGIEYGVPVAVVVYALYLLYRHARPRHEVRIHGNTVCFYFNGGWNFPGVDYVWKRITSEITVLGSDLEREKTRAVVIECSKMPEIDYSIAQAIREGCDDLRKKDIRVIIVNAQSQVIEVLERANIENLELMSSVENALEAVSEGLKSEEDSTLFSQPKEGTPKGDLNTTVQVCTDD